MENIEQYIRHKSFPEVALAGTTTLVLPGVAQGSFHLDPTEICTKDRRLNLQNLPANLSPFET